MMHPVQQEDFEEVSWREVAAMSGRTVTALTNFEDLLPAHDIGVGLPAGGDVTPGLCTRLAGA
ncbi:MAG TPA: hypothetical protein VH478_16800 [Trebonia sp.]|nr:hypothetical protein [Trebonia sp.]